MRLPTDCQAKKEPHLEKKYTIDIADFALNVYFGNEFKHFTFDYE
jgi:hypothetical protein